MNRRTQLNEIYADDVNASLGFDYSHMGYWADQSAADKPGASDPTNVEDPAQFGVAQTAYVRHLSDRLQLSPGDRVLDIGGGQGATAVWLAQNHGVEVVVVDAVPEMLTQANRRVHEAGLDERITCIHQDFLEYDSIQRFDAAIAIESLYHIRDQDQAFRNIKRLLRPGGRFCFSTYVSDMRPRFLRTRYLLLTVGDRDIPQLDRYTHAITAAGLKTERIDNVTRFVLPRSSAVLRSEPYFSRLRDYVSDHYGRIPAALLPYFLNWHDRSVRHDNLCLFFVDGCAPKRGE